MDALREALGTPVPELDDEESDDITAGWQLLADGLHIHVKANTGKSKGTR